MDYSKIQLHLSRKRKTLAHTVKMSCIAFDGSKTISFGIGEIQSISPLIQPRRVTNSITTITDSVNANTRKQLYRHIPHDFEIKSGSRIDFTPNKVKDEKSEEEDERYESPGFHNNDDTDRVVIKNYQQHHQETREIDRPNIFTDDVENNANSFQRKSTKDTRGRNAANNKPLTLPNNNNNNSDKNKMEEILRLQNKMAKLQNEVAAMQKQVLFLQKQI